MSIWKPQRKEDLRVIQNGKLKQLLVRAMNSEAYREKFKAKGVTVRDVRDIADLGKLPITHKTEVPERMKSAVPLGGYAAVPLDDVKRFFISPGPLIHGLTSNDARVWRTNGAKCFSLCGVRPNDVASVTTSYHMVPAGFMGHDALEELGCAVIPTGPGQTQAQIQVLKSLRVTVLFGFTEFLLHLADAARKDFGMDPGRDLSLRLSVSVPLPQRPERNEIEEKLGLRERATQIYGVAELGIIGAECSLENGIHLLEESFVLEMLDPHTGEPVEPGKPGEIVLTSLDIEGMPKLRYATGDLAIHAVDPCNCGLQESRIVKFVGRVDEVTKVKGLFVFPAQIEEAIKSFPTLGRFQAVVERPSNIDVLRVRVECKEETANLGNKLIRTLKERIGIEVEIEFLKPNELQPENKRILDKRTGSLTW
ncbi:MAG: phenylacetate--CoA ligase family protein [Candidatus Bathyarchaeia archaeon]